MKLRFPHTYVIIFALILIAAALTWFFPGGDYIQKVTLKDGKEVKEMVYQQVESNPQTWQVFSALYKGFVKQAGIVIFILMIGGAFWIMNTTRAMDAGIMAFIRFTKSLEKYSVFKLVGVNNVIIVMIMLLFSLFGSVFGMSEETIAFVIILVPLAVSMGYDSIVGVCLCYLGAHLGFAASTLNPFTVGIAQGIAELPLFSGLEYRFICWIIINIVGISFVLIYARIIKNNPKRSPVYIEDDYWRQRTLGETDKIEYHTPWSAWVVFGIIMAVLVTFSIFYPVTNLKIGNLEMHIPAMPVVTGLFAISGLFSLRKSVHFFS
jgi:uncharacterized ion transporter superfamily protein YfcC